MEIKWYWPAQMLGLLRDVSSHGDGSTWEVSSRCGEVFGWIVFGLIVFLLCAAFCTRFIAAKRSGEQGAKVAVNSAAGVLLLYALLLAVGVGPYVQFYPQSAGFLDFSALEHILQGIVCAMVALLTGGFGWIGAKLGKKRRDDA